MVAQVLCHKYIIFSHHHNSHHWYMMGYWLMIGAYILSVADNISCVYSHRHTQTALTSDIYWRRDTDILMHLNQEAGRDRHFDGHLSLTGRWHGGPGVLCVSVVRVRFGWGGRSWLVFRTMHIHTPACRCMQSEGCRRAGGTRARLNPQWERGSLGRGRRGWAPPSYTSEIPPGQRFNAHPHPSCLGTAPATLHPGVW